MVQKLATILNLNVDEASLKHLLSSFVCVEATSESSRDVMTFLLETSVDMERRGLTRTYLILDDEMWANDMVKIDGFFSLALKTIYFSKETDKNLIEKIFGERNKKSCPAYLIAQLARSVDSKAGKGAECLQTALSYITNAQDIVGGRLVYLDCKPERRVYYENNGFTFLQNKHNSDLVQMYKVI